MHPRNSACLCGLLVYFIGVSHLPILCASPVNVSTTDFSTITGDESAYPSSTLTSSATENTSLLASISDSNATMQVVSPYTTAAPTAATSATLLVSTNPTGIPTTSQGHENVDLSSNVASSSTENTVAISSSTTTQFVTVYTTAAPTTSLQSETLHSSSAAASSSEGTSTPNTSLLTTNGQTRTTANETGTSSYADTTSSFSETPSTTSTLINASTLVTTTTPEVSTTTGTTSTTGTISTTGTTSTTQCTTTTTKKPKQECVIDDADLLDQLRKELINDEGYKEEIYNDTTGNPTFGIGHKITSDDPEYGKPLGTKISKERIEEAFNADVKAAIDSCCKLFDDFQNLPEEVQLIILNMRFNLGHSGLEGFKKFREAVNNGDWDEAADEMVDSRWYEQVPNRAKRLVERMRKVPKGC